jgi:hypothetical protein
MSRATSREYQDGSISTVEVMLIEGEDVLGGVAFECFSICVSSTGFVFFPFVVCFWSCREPVVEDCDPLRPKLRAEERDIPIT